MNYEELTGEDFVDSFFLMRKRCHGMMIEREVSTWKREFTK